MDYNIVLVEDNQSLNEFTMLPFELYKNNSFWVPPLISEYKKYVSGVNNNLNVAGPNEKILCIKNGKVVGRILIGIDNILNDYKNLRVGYISQFECEEDYNIAKTMLDWSVKWFKDNGINRIKGPLSLPDGDDNRGFIIDNFEEQVFVMNTYNLPYYNDYFLKYGFTKYNDCYAYKADLNTGDINRFKRIVPLAMKRYKFHLSHLSKSNIKQDAEDIRHVLEQAMPEEWEDFMPLTQEDAEKVVKKLIPFIDESLIFIAKTDEGVPVGFNVTLPDYNQALKHLDGKLFPFGFLKFLYYKRKIDRLRMFVLFVIPEYRQKGVASAIYLQTYLTALEKGYKELEGSTIWEYNLPMMNEVQNYGLSPNITYRIYELYI